MRTHLEFISTEFSPYPQEEQEVNPGRYGKRLAEYIASCLPKHGFKVRDVFAEDWGWVVRLEHKPFSLWIGCGNYGEFENGFLCFIEPSKPLVHKWFSVIETQATTEPLAEALERVLRDSGKVSQLRWWSEEKSRI